MSPDTSKSGFSPDDLSEIDLRVSRDLCPLIIILFTVHWWKSHGIPWHEYVTFSLVYVVLFF